VQASASDSFKTFLQVVALAIALVLVAMIVHKGTVDISALAQKHSGGEFWMALVKYILGNLGAGGGAK
jgi:hypothetical protein